MNLTQAKNLNYWRPAVILVDGLPLGVAYHLCVFDNHTRKVHELSIISMPHAVTGFLNRALVCEAETSVDCARFLVDLASSGVAVMGAEG